MSKLTANLIGVRVAGSPTYTPAHINAAGKTIRQMATFSVYANGKGESDADKFKITAWGRMADSVAKSCAKGKKLTLVCSINTFRGRVPYPNANPGAPVQYVMDAQGQPLLINKTGFTIEEIDYGVDSADLIVSEIRMGCRGQYWNVVGHNDEAAWKATCKQRNELEYVIGATHFGYAVVQTPTGTIIDWKTIKTNNNVGTAFVQHAGNTGAVNTGFAGVAPVTFGGAPVGYPANTGGFVPPVNPAFQQPSAPAFHM